MVHIPALNCSKVLVMTPFHNDFDDVTEHGDLLLEWGHENETDYPLVIHVRLLNKTSEYGVNTMETDISTGLTDDSFLWEDLPSPLPFLSTATYELQVLRQQRAGDVMSEPVIASSPPFAILPQNGSDGEDGQPTMNGTADSPSELTSSTDSSGRPSSITAIAAGLVVPFVVGVSVLVFLYMWRRRKKIQEERRKEREGLVID